MIGKVLRGGRPDGLIRYLYGPGRHEEHTDPHIVAAWRDPGWSRRCAPVAAGTSGR